MPRALVVANQDLQAAGFVGDALEQRGFRLEPVVREVGHWPDLGGVDLVVVLGSEWHVHDESARAQVAGEAAFVKAAHGRGVPVFGVCYGAQILSHALGGTVHRADTIELGWLEVEPLHPAVPPGPWMQWHSDTFTVPPGAELLARSAVGPQAIRLGRSFAVQFHPEVDAEMVASWVRDDGGRDLKEAGVDTDVLIERSRAQTLQSEPSARALVGWFCSEVAAG